MQARARTFAQGIEAADARLSVEVDHDASAQVVGRRGHGDVFPGDVDAEAQALPVDVREVAARLLGILVGDVEIDVVVAPLLHLVVDGPGHDVARGEREARVILLHELLAVERTEHAAIAAHGLGDEVAGAVAGVEQGRGVELDELHAAHRALGPVDHRDAVARGHQRVGGVPVDRLAAARGHHGDARQEGVDAARVLVEHVGSEALDARCVARHDDAQVMLGDDFHGEVVIEDVYAGVALDGLDEAGLDFGSGVVLVVQDAKFRVSAFAVQVEVARVVLVEVHTPADELLDLRRCAAHHHLDGCPVVDPVAGHHRVMDVFVEVVHLEVGHRGDSPLGEVGVGFFEFRLADDGDGLALFGHLEGKAHAGDARADNQIIVFVNHFFRVFG